MKYNLVCLDTTFIIDLIRKQIDAITKLQDLARSNTDLKITPITAAELYVGAYNVKNKKLELKEVDDILNNLQILPISREATKIYGRKHLELATRYPGDRDLFIASVAIAYNESLLTRDKDFENIPELQIETW